MKARTVLGRGEESQVSGHGSELRLGRGKEKREGEGERNSAKIIDGMTQTKQKHYVSCEFCRLNGPYCCKLRDTSASRFLCATITISSIKQHQAAFCSSGKQQHSKRQSTSRDTHRFHSMCKLRMAHPGLSDTISGRGGHTLSLAWLCAAIAGNRRCGRSKAASPVSSIC